MMKFKIIPYSLQELGKRENQEDSIFPVLGKSTENDRLFILCDGMGGHENGEVASSTVCEVMSSTILAMWNPRHPLTDQVLQTALASAYDALDTKDHGELRKMGTTLTFLCFHAGGVTVAHIGDSRVYQLRPASGGNAARIVFRTEDHSLVNDLIKVGEITEAEAKCHPGKNVITRAMQPCANPRCKADISHLTDIRSGDYFYMCSDGMLEQTTDDNILNVITKPDATDEQKIEILRSVTDDNLDNHTAQLIHVVDVKGMAPTAVKLRPLGIIRKLIFNDIYTPTKATSRRKKLPLAWIVVAVVLAVVAIASVVVLKDCDGSKPVDNATEREVKSSATGSISSKKELMYHNKDTSVIRADKDIPSTGPSAVDTVKSNASNAEKLIKQNKTVAKPADGVEAPVKMTGAQVTEQENFTEI